MRIHADFTKAVIITPNDYHWVKSPNGEVKRMMFERIGEEQARATSIVEFAAQYRNFLNIHTCLVKKFYCYQVFLPKILNSIILKVGIYVIHISQHIKYRVKRAVRFL